jgi:hypothetical protein
MSRLQTTARALAPAIAIAAALTCGGHATADSLEKLSENFDADALPAGWTRINNSSGDPFSNKSWFKPNVDGDGLAFLADDHVPNVDSTLNTYFAANLDSTTVDYNGTISNWLIGPPLEFNNGDTISFITRTITGSKYPDRLQLRFGEGNSASPAERPTSGFNFANADVDVGNFTTQLLLQRRNSVGDPVGLPTLGVNPNLQGGGYPEEWTKYTATFAGLSGPTTGRFAFRYFVTDAGQLDDYGNVVGVDRVTVTAVPEPAAYLMMALGLGAIGLRRLRATRS